MKYEVGSFTVYELGDEIYPGFHVGDRIRRTTDRFPSEGWVSNIKTNHGYEDRAFVISSRDDPNEILKGDQPGTLCHGDWIMEEDVQDVTVIECDHIMVTDEEVAELFGMTLLEMIPEDGSSM